MIIINDNIRHGINSVITLAPSWILHRPYTMAYPTRKIDEKNVSAIGFGAMGISSFYGDIDPDEERFKVGVDRGS